MRQAHAEKESPEKDAKLVDLQHKIDNPPELTSLPPPTVKITKIKAGGVKTRGQGGSTKVASKFDENSAGAAARDKVASLKVGNADGDEK